MSADPLDEIMQDAPPTPRGVSRVSYTHDAMIDMLIANPAMSQNELALRFGYTPSWISTVMQSDAFQAKFAARRSELVDPQLRESIELSFKGILARSQEILAEKLNAPASALPDNLVLRAAELSSKALGYGARGPMVQVNVQNNRPADERLTDLAGNLVGLLRKAKSEAGHDPKEVTDADFS